MLALVFGLAALAGRPPPPSSADGCLSRNRDEVVVCGSRSGQNPYRLPKLPDRYDPRQIRAETDVLPGVHTRAHIDTQTRPDGNQDNRLMLTFSTRF
jgi:hypothetical protein